MHTLKINEVEYRIAGKLTAKEQWHVAKRLGPALVATMGLALIEEAGPIVALGKVAEAVAAMPDADSDFITDLCLSVCERKQESGLWSKVMNSGTLMFSDLRMDAMLVLTVEVVKLDVIPFLPKHLLGLAQGSA